MRSILLLDLEGKDFSRKEKILYFLMTGFFVTLFLPHMPVVNNLFIGLLCAYSFFENSWTEKIQLLKARKEVIFMLLFFAIHIISALFSANRQEAYTMLGMRIPLLLFPVSLGLIYISRELKFRILLMYCLTVTLAALVCLAYSYFQFRKWHDASWLYDDSLTFVIDRQSIYFALMVNFTLFGFTYLLLKKSFVLEHPGLVYISIAFLLIIHFMLASRISIISLYTGLLVIALAYAIKNKQLLKGFVLIGTLAAVLLLLIHFFPKTMNRFRELAYTSYKFDGKGVESHYNMKVTPDQWNGMNIRLAVWKCGWELVSEGGHWLFGVPLGDKQDRLMDVYRSKHFDFALSTNRNLHNTYLDILCSFGIIGLIVFLLGYLIFPAINCYRTNDALGGFILITFTISLFTETYIDKSVGCILLGFFISFMSSYKNDQPLPPEPLPDTAE